MPDAFTTVCNKARCFTSADHFYDSALTVNLTAKLEQPLLELRLGGLADLDGRVCFNVLLAITTKVSYRPGDKVHIGLRVVLSSSIRQGRRAVFENREDEPGFAVQEASGKYVASPT